MFVIDTVKGAVPEVAEEVNPAFGFVSISLSGTLVPSIAIPLYTIKSSRYPVAPYAAETPYWPPIDGYCVVLPIVEALVDVPFNTPST